MDESTAPDAIARKARSEQILRTEGVPINAYLPVIESENETRSRSVEEVAHRALALLVVAVKGEGLEQSIVDRIVEDYGLAQYFTPRERAFLVDTIPSQQDRIQFTWRYESAWTLLWALRYVERLERPASICDVERAVTIMQERSTVQFIAEANLRPLTQIFDEVDRIYRYHWAVVDARINGQPTPAGLEPGVTFERHHALNWLIRYMDQEWDEVTTDT